MELRSDSLNPTFELLEDDGDVYVQVHLPWGEGDFDGDPDTVANYFERFAHALRTHVNDWHNGHVEAAAYDDKAAP